MAPVLNIVVSCTDRKRASVPDALKVGTVGPMPIGRRFALWWERLLSSRTESIEANHLYLGDHWQICRSLPALAEAKGFRAHLWIASAGYGLVAADALLHPYSATFAMGQRDAVVTADEGREGLREWWSLLARRNGPVGGAPRKVVDLVRSEPHCHVLLVCSPSYVGALSDDIAEALKEIADKERFLIVTSRSSLPTHLKAHVIPSEARLKSLVGGALPSLHARVARKILSEARDSRLHAPSLRTRYVGLIRRAPELSRHDRLVMTDAQVKQFVQASLKTHPTMARTPLLRDLRDRGYACEQSRFGRLFGQAAGNAG